MKHASSGETPALVEHLERVLGPIEHGWSTDPDGVTMPLQVVKFSAGSDVNSVGYATLGLSRHNHRSSVSGQAVRQELLMLASNAVDEDVVASLLIQIGMNAMSVHPVLRGQVIGPAEPLLPGSSLTALYAAPPVYFPDNFSTCVVDGETVFITWLIPISTDEATFVLNRGWEAFEEELARHDPDLVDFGRPGLEI